MKLREPRTLEMFCMLYLMFMFMTVLTGCAVLDFIVGKDPASITKELDVNKDGKLSPEEIKISAYDLDKNGELSLAEMEAAMAPHAATDLILGAMAILNVPFAGAATIALKQARQHKKDLKSVVGGIEEVVSLKEDGITKADIYEGIKIVSSRLGNAKNLAEAVAPIKNAIRLEKALSK